MSKWFRKLVPIIWLIIWRLPITPIATAQKKTNRSTSSNTLCCHGYHGRSGRTISGLQDGQASSASPLFRSLQNIRTSGVCVSEGPRRRKGRRGGGSGHNQQWSTVSLPGLPLPKININLALKQRSTKLARLVQQNKSLFSKLYWC